jgi:hypothetical protein
MNRVFTLVISSFIVGTAATACSSQGGPEPSSSQHDSTASAPCPGLNTDPSCEAANGPACAGLVFAGADVGWEIQTHILTDSKCISGDTAKGILGCIGGLNFGVPGTICAVQEAIENENLIPKAIAEGGCAVVSCLAPFVPALEPLVTACSLERRSVRFLGSFRAVA